MKRYLLFAWCEWDREGGLDNLVGDFDSVEEAREILSYYDIAKVLDTKTGEQISL